MRQHFLILINLFLVGNVLLSQTSLNLLNETSFPIASITGHEILSYYHSPEHHIYISSQYNNIGYLTKIDTAANLLWQNELSNSADVNKLTIDRAQSQIVISNSIWIKRFDYEGNLLTNIPLEFSMKLVASNEGYDYLVQLLEYESDILQLQLHKHESTVGSELILEREYFVGYGNELSNHFIRDVDINSTENHFDLSVVITENDNNTAHQSLNVLWRLNWDGQIILEDEIDSFQPANSFFVNQKIQYGLSGAMLIQKARDLFFSAILSECGVYSINDDSGILTPVNYQFFEFSKNLALIGRNVISCINQETIATTSQSNFDHYYKYGMQGELKGYGIFEGKLYVINFLDIDSDQDGVFSFQDCDDNNPNIFLGNNEILNNDIDDDCDSITSDIVSTCYLNYLNIHDETQLTEFLTQYNDCNVIVEGNFEISSNLDLSEIDNLKRVTGTLNILGESIYGNLELPNIDEIDTLRVYQSGIDTLKLSSYNINVISIIENQSLEYINTNSELRIQKTLRLSKNFNYGHCSTFAFCQSILENEVNLHISQNASECYNNSDFLQMCNFDLDGDGFGSIEDCDDTNAEINPAQDETTYNGIDDDCNSATLDDDLDQDGFLLFDDCDDNNPNINPNAEEIPNNDIDEDCDGIDLMTSTYEIANSTIKIFPNPTIDIIYIEVEGKLNYNVSLSDLEGQLIQTSINSSQINIEAIPQGTYLLQIEDFKTGQRIVERILVMK